MSEQDLTADAITAIRTLSIDMVQAANSGHPGLPMGCAPIGYLLFKEVMAHDPASPDWLDRDRFVLSAGHGSALLYSLLHLTGYDNPTLDEVKQFRQLGSPTAGHPEHDHLAGVETTTGPLGQGFANGVGMAIAERRLAAEFNRPGHEVVDHRVYAIVSDGDLMEGVASEAASLAGTLRLGKLVYLYDDNEISIDGDTDQTFTEDVLARFDAYGWHTSRVDDGNDLEALRSAIKAAEADERPSLIGVRTTIGYGSPNKAGTAKAHGSPLGEDEVAATRAAYGWDHGPFEIPADVRAVLDHRGVGAETHEAWRQRWAAYRDEHPELADELSRRIEGQLPAEWTTSLPDLSATSQATRASSGDVINAIAGVLPELVGGSADLAGSNNTDVEGGGVMSADQPLGRNVRFGVREHAMGSIANGMALHGGFVPYVATFLVFTDYCRPAIRLSALMRQKVVWVMTHDSVGLGEDGPTHQPVEHLASLRAIPDLQVVRPADGAEVVRAWEAALTHDGPTLLVLTRQGLPSLQERTGTAVPADAVSGGAWAVRDHDAPQVVLIGTGSEVQVALDAADALAADGVAARVVSMPCWERFAERSAEDRAALLGEGIPRVAVEAAATFGWGRWVGDGAVVGIDRFGVSGPGDDALEALGITADAVVAAARDLVG